MIILIRLYCEFILKKKHNIFYFDDDLIVTDRTNDETRFIRYMNMSLAKRLLLHSLPM